MNQNVLGGDWQGGECLDTSGYYCKQNSDESQIDGTVDIIRGIGSSQESGSGSDTGGSM